MMTKEQAREFASRQVEKLHSRFASASDDAVRAKEFEMKLPVAVIEDPIPLRFDRAGGTDPVDDEKNVCSAEDPKAAEFFDSVRVAVTGIRAHRGNVVD
ncbi:MAG TPA: hypothetical protein PK745_11795, partial [bacterium]|nr:hypothetical protein [bacterium]